MAKDDFYLSDEQRMIRDLARKVAREKSRPTPILLVEQNVLRALRLSHRAYVLENGTIVLEGASQELLANDAIKRAYLGR